MPAAKFKSFSGMLPRVSAELLPDTAAQEAVNCALASGDILPAGAYLNVVPSPIGGSGPFRDNTRTIFGMRNPANTDEMMLVTWDDAVEYTLGEYYASGNDQLLYYTDYTGARYTSFRRMRRMGAPYPTNSYRLGMPLPEIKISVESTDKKIPGYDGGQLPGVKENPNIRSYVFTYFHALFKQWESIASEPSDPIEVVEGTVCKISGLPWTPPVPDGDEAYPIGGINVYRTVTSTSGTDFYKVVTLPFYCPVASIAVDGDEQTVVTHSPHQLGIGEWFKTNDFMPVTKVLEVIDEYTVRATYKGDDAFSDPNSLPRIVYDITPQWTRSTVRARRNPFSRRKYGGGDNLYTSPNPDTGEGFSWWDGTNLMRGESFEDWYDVVTLTTALPSDDYDPPPSNLRGIIRVNDEIMCGHASGKLYFSEPGVASAWPALYEIYVPENIVSLVPISSGVLVLTDGHPYVAHVSDPATGVSLEKINTVMPCLNKSTVVAMPYGIVWMSTGGLALFRGSGAVSLISEPVIRPIKYMDTTAGPAWQIPRTDDVSLAEPIPSEVAWLRLFAKAAFAWFDGFDYVLAWSPAWNGGDNYFAAGVLSFVYTGESGYFVRWHLSGSRVALTVGSSPAVASQSASAATAAPTIRDKYVVDRDMELFDNIRQYGWDGSLAWLNKWFHGRKAVVDPALKYIQMRYDDTYAGLVSQIDVDGAGVHLPGTTIAKYRLSPGVYMLSGSKVDRHTHPSGVDHGDNSNAHIECMFYAVLHKEYREEFIHCQPDGDVIFTVEALPKYTAQTITDPIVEIRLSIDRAFWADYERERARGTPMQADKQYPITIDVTLAPKLVKLKELPPGAATDEQCVLLEDDTGDAHVLETGAGNILLESQTTIVPVAPPLPHTAGAVPQAVWHDTRTDNTFCVYRDTAGGLQSAILDLHSITDVNGARWKSKVLTLSDFHNIGAARVIADFPENNTTALVTFRLYVNKVLVAEVPLSSSLPFRLPTNYRADAFEVELVNIRCRVRAVHIAETMMGLKEV